MEWYRPSRVSDFPIGSNWLWWNNIASRTLLLPHPLGPTSATIREGCGPRSIVRSLNLLYPFFKWSDLIRTSDRIVWRRDRAQALESSRLGRGSRGRHRGQCDRRTSDHREKVHRGGRADRKKSDVGPLLWLPALAGRTGYTLGGRRICFWGMEGLALDCDQIWYLSPAFRRSTKPVRSAVDPGCRRLCPWRDTCMCTRKWRGDARDPIRRAEVRELRGVSRSRDRRALAWRGRTGSRDRRLRGCRRRVV